MGVYNGNIVVDNVGGETDLFGDTDTVRTTHCLIDGGCNEIGFQLSAVSGQMDFRIVVTVLEVDRQTEPCCTFISS